MGRAARSWCLRPISPDLALGAWTLWPLPASPRPRTLRQFANHVPLPCNPPHPPPPPPSSELTRALASRSPPQLGVIDKMQFFSVLGTLFAGAQKQQAVWPRLSCAHAWPREHASAVPTSAPLRAASQVLGALADAYGTGDVDPRGGWTHVRWKDFSTDFEQVEPAPLNEPGLQWKGGR